MGRPAHPPSRQERTGCHIFCDTPDAAKAKYRELLDVLLRQNGVYVGSKEKRKLKASRGKSGDIVVPSSLSTR